MRFLKKLAASGQAILCTIHQPNASLFENFDRLLLLQRGGECVYFGQTNNLLGYFEKHGAYCPPNANIAEWMLDAIGAGQTARIGNRDWADIWRTSEELANVKTEITAIKEARIASVGADPAVQSHYATPLSFQIGVVVKRMNIAFWRTPNYGFTRFFNHICISLLTGIVFINLDDSLSSLQYRVFVIFQVTVLPSLILAQVEPMYDFARLISYREMSSRMYKPFAFTIAMVIAEMPYSLLCAFGFFVCIYFPVGMDLTPNRAGYQFLIILICEQFSVSLAQMMQSITPNFYIASLLTPFIVVIFALFCGVTIPAPNIPGFWRSWLYHLDPLTRLIGGMVVTELHDKPVVCTAMELASFNAPTGATCGEYASEFMAHASGYIKDLNATDICQYCAYKVGDEFYEPLGLSFDNRWRDLGILAAFTASSTIFLFLGSQFLNFSRR